MNERERICLFAGTTEGRQLARILAPSTELTVCVATEYGEILLDGIAGIEVRAGRMDEGEMASFFRERRFSRILDATHPYAALVTENIQAAAKEAGIPVLRILRETDREIPDAVYVNSVEEARDWLAEREGNVFLTTGSKELGSYIGLDLERVWARVLPTAAALEACAQAGIPSSHVIAAQGPFSEEINLAEMKSIGARYLVTKASGKAGGFDEKIRAARTAGVTPVIIGRPAQIEGLTLADALRELGKTLPLRKTAVKIVGIGPGAEDAMTARAREAVRTGDLLLGAKSVVGSLGAGRETVFAYTPDKILEALESHPEAALAVVLMRGDTGFYSGAKKLTDALSDVDVEIIPGVSSVSCFAAKLGVSWDDAALVSLHGRSVDLLRTVSENRRTFALTGGENTPGRLCETLAAGGLGAVRVTVGERLSYPDERITAGTANELQGREFDSLSVLYLENDDAARPFRCGIPDEEFLRGDVPMTKSEVRAVSLSKLAPPEDAVIWDIGAGTGSVSVECAFAAPKGWIYAVEKEADACELIRQNAAKFRLGNLTVIEGTAPEALRDLPAPTHAFIGGSSGNLSEIIAALLGKNPAVRIVLNAVTVETRTEAALAAKEFGFAVCETAEINVSRARKLGRYHMMTAQNPVTVVTLAGGRQT